MKRTFIEKFAIGIIIFVIIAMIVLIGFNAFILTHPDVIGMWFKKLLGSFK